MERYSEEYYRIEEMIFSKFESMSGVYLNDISKKTGLPLKKLEEFSPMFEYNLNLFDSQKTDKMKMEQLHLDKDTFLSEKSKYYVSKMVFRSELPRILYKYKPINEFLLTMLNDKQIWLPSLKEFNDVYEGLNPIPDNIKDADLIKYKELLESNYRITFEAKYKAIEALRSNLKNVFQSKIEKTRIGAFTTKPNNKLMWAHYADSNKGACIEFDISEDYDLFDFISPVTYSDQIPENNFFDQDEFSLIPLYFTKSKDWCYEEEYRLLKRNESKNLFDYNQTAIKSIIFGCRSSQEDERRIIELVEKNEYNLKFKKVIPSGTSYELEIVEY